MYLLFCLLYTTTPPSPTQAMKKGLCFIIVCSTLFVYSAFVLAAKLYSEREPYRKTFPAEVLKTKIGGADEHKTAVYSA